MIQSQVESSSGSSHLRNDNHISNLPYLKDQGNITPKQLYDLILDGRGKPDRVAIDLYTDLRNWYKLLKKNGNDGSIQFVSKTKEGLLQTSYSYLATKFKFSADGIRKKLVKLEQMGLIKREFHDIVRQGYRCNNVLHIKIFKQTPYFISEIGVDHPGFVQSQPIESLV